MPQLSEDQDLKAYSKDQFVCNECDTDQYRESQPGSGLANVADLFARLDGRSWDGYDRATVLGLLHKWIEALQNFDDDWYAGNDELAPLLEIYFDVCWADGEHPYATTLQELIEYREEMEALD